MAGSILWFSIHFWFLNACNTSVCLNFLVVFNISVCATFFAVICSYLVVLLSFPLAFFFFFFVFFFHLLSMSLLDDVGRSRSGAGSGNPLFRKLDEFLVVNKHIILPIAKVSLLSTFFEDGLRMMLQHADQARYIRHIWKGTYAFAYAFIVLNCLIQLLPATLILLRKQVKVAIGCLMFAALLQTIVYKMWFDWTFFLRTLSVTGGLLFVLADELNQASNIFSLSFSTNVNKSSNWLQLAGRLLIIIMFLTHIRFTGGFRIAVEVVGFVLMGLVAIGFQTKRSAFVLVVLLLVENVIFNAFWMIPIRQKNKFDFTLYDFFQTMSVIGGLLMIVALGAGGVSLDKSKKSI
eukprot:m.186918 g.186918  ORF g.186918 m.186918 type:complete len:349 (-) comp13622_c2_seq2:5948-6994(-)